MIEKNHHSSLAKSRRPGQAFSWPVVSWLGRFYAKAPGLRPRATRKAPAVYATLLNGVRESRLFDRLGIAADFNGRFELLVLSIWLFLEHYADPALQLQWQKRLSEVLLADCEAAFREVGAGEAKLPKLARQFYESLRGRLRAYQQGAASGSDALAEALARNLGSSIEDAQTLALALLEAQPAPQETQALTAAPYASYASHAMTSAASVAAVLRSEL